MAAGLGFKTFATGDVLTAADTNGYLMQGVLVFASAAARTSAITSPQEGQVSYLKDTDATEYYNGSAWTSVGGLTYSYFAAKNSIINGCADIWQRGTSFTIAASTQTYTADRWMAYRTTTGATVTRQNTSPNYNPYYIRVARDNGNATTNVIYLTQAIETLNSKPLANKTVTLSWWARAGANFSAASSNMTWELAYGTGTDQNMITGFTGQTNITAGTKTLTTSWQQFSTTGTVSSTATQLGLNFYFTPVGTAGAADYMEIADVQLELGSVATTVARSGGTYQGELANCQRYYYRTTTAAGSFRASGFNITTAIADVCIPLQTTMRVAPASLDVTGTAADYEIKHQNTSTACSAVPTLLEGSWNSVTIRMTVASGLTLGQGCQGRTTANGYVGWSAEL